MAFFLTQNVPIRVPLVIQQHLLMVQPLPLFVLIPFVNLIPPLLVLLHSFLFPHIVEILLPQSLMLPLGSVIRVKVLIEPLLICIIWLVPFTYRSDLKSGWNIKLPAVWNLDCGPTI